MAEQKDDKKGGIGCFILVFLMFASGIPLATEGEGPIGTFVVVVIGLIGAYYLAKVLTGRD